MQIQKAPGSLACFGSAAECALAPLIERFSMMHIALSMWMITHIHPSDQLLEAHNDRRGAEGMVHSLLDKIKQGVQQQTKWTGTMVGQADYPFSSLVQGEYEPHRGVHWDTHLC